MDPLLYKKLDWEVTHGHDMLHHEAFQVRGACAQRAGPRRLARIDRSALPYGPDDTNTSS